jgi:hypothetical protein
LIFLHLIDRFTPTHIQVLGYFQSGDPAILARFREQRDFSDQATQPIGLWGTQMTSDPSSGGLLLLGGEQTGDVVVNNTWLFTLVH